MCSPQIDLCSCSSLRRILRFADQDTITSLSRRTTLVLSRFHYHRSRPFHGLCRIVHQCSPTRLPALRLNSHQAVHTPPRRSSYSLPALPLSIILHSQTQLYLCHSHVLLSHLTHCIPRWRLTNLVPLHGNTRPNLSGSVIHVYFVKLSSIPSLTSYFLYIRKYIIWANEQLIPSIIQCCKWRNTV